MIQMKTWNYEHGLRQIIEMGISDEISVTMRDTSDRH